MKKNVRLYASVYGNCFNSKTLNIYTVNTHTVYPGSLAKRGGDI